MGQKSPIIRAAKAKHLTTVAFPRFDRRPTNYFRGMIPTEQVDDATEKMDSQADMERELKHEREQLQQAHELRIQQAVDVAVQRERAEAQAEMKKAVDLLNGFVRITRAQIDELKQRWEKQTIELAFDAAAAIVGMQIESRPETVSHMVKEAVHQMANVEKILIRVNPDDLDLIRSAAKKWYNDGDISTQAEIRPDPTLSRGDSMIESDHGMTDARISSQIARLKSEARNSQ